MSHQSGPKQGCATGNMSWWPVQHTQDIFIICTLSWRCPQTGNRNSWCSLKMEQALWSGKKCLVLFLAERPVMILKFQIIGLLSQLLNTWALYPFIYSLMHTVNSYRAAAATRKSFVPSKEYSIRKRDTDTPVRHRRRVRRAWELEGRRRAPSLSHTHTPCLRHRPLCTPSVLLPSNTSEPQVLT